MSKTEENYFKTERYTERRIFSRLLLFPTYIRKQKSGFPKPLRPPTYAGTLFIQPRSKGVGRGLLSAQDSIYSEICSLGVCMKRSKEKLIQAVKEERLLSKGETGEEFKQCKEKKGQKIKKKRWWKVHF